MKEFTKVEREFWETDEARDMTPEEKYFWLYLQTNSNVNTLGCYAFRMRKAQDETGYNRETVEKLLHRMTEMGLIVYTETGYVMLLDWYRTNWNRNTNTKRALMGDLKDVKDESLRGYLEEKLTATGVFAEKKETEEQKETEKDTLRQMETDGDSQGGERERERERKEKDQKKSGGAAFRPPTLSEVAEYCRERKNGVDPQRFIDFYEAKGWMIGKNRMKSWKAAVRTWEREDGQKTGTPPVPKKPEENRILLERMRMAGVEV